jgi:FixJ family two-component response regulator
MPNLLQTQPAMRQSQPSRAVVHVIDDDFTFCEAVTFILETAGYEARVYQSAEHFLSCYVPQPLQCAIVDLRMPGMSGLELQNDLIRCRQSLPLVIISAYGQTPDIVQAIRKGADNYLEKPVEECELLSAIHAAIAKDHETKQRNLRRDTALWQLSDRERQVADLFVEAKTTIEIAHILGISPKTVERHRVNIFEKTNVDSVPALIRLML